MDMKKETESIVANINDPEGEVRTREQERILQYFYSLLFSPVPPDGLPQMLGDSNEALQITQTIKELREALKMASKGDFTYKVTVKGFVGGALKSLQANFNHIAWLTRRVADGDLEQRMDFKGDFAAAFNSMVQHLSLMLEELKSKQEHLEQLAQELKQEIEVRKATEKKLRKEEERWHLAVRCSRDGIWDIRFEGDEAPYYSPRLLELLGFSAEELGGVRDWVNIFHPDDKQLIELYNNFLNEEGALPSFSVEHKLRCADGDYRWFLTRGMLVRDPETRLPVRLIGVTADIQERKEREEYYAHRATHDILTGLPNRALFAERLQDGIEFAKRYGLHLAVVMGDLDGFKNVNDTLGHHAGDALLVEIASRLQACMRGSDTVARLGGDEFAFLSFFAPEEWQGLVAVLGRIMNAVQRPVNFEDYKICVTTSLGVTIAPEDGNSPSKLLVQADEAMYRAKAEGRNVCYFWKKNGEHTKLNLETPLKNQIT